MLFVPGDSPRKYARAVNCGADALILDLEDAVAASNKEAARKHVVGLIQQRSESEDFAIFVRVNPLGSGLTHDDLADVVKPGLNGVLLPKANSAEDVLVVAEEIRRLEHYNGMKSDSVRIAVVATETPQAMFNLGTYSPPHPRLVALTWGAEDLASAIGATSNKCSDGSWTAPYVHARNMCLFAAASAGVNAIDTLYSEFRDIEGLKRACDESRRDGFTGRIAIHPDQVPVINQCYTPSSAERAEAEEIVRAFEEQPGAGVVVIAGKMLDLPHLKAAQKIISASKMSNKFS